MVYSIYTVFTLYMHCSILSVIDTGMYFYRLCARRQILWRAHDFV